MHVEVKDLDVAVTVVFAVIVVVDFVDEVKDEETTGIQDVNTKDILDLTKRKTC